MVLVAGRSHTKSTGQRLSRCLSFAASLENGGALFPLFTARSFKWQQTAQYGMFFGMKRNKNMLSPHAF